MFKEGNHDDDGAASILGIQVYFIRSYHLLPPQTSLFCNSKSARLATLPNQRTRKTHLNSLLCRGDRQALVRFRRLDEPFQRHLKCLQLASSSRFPQAKRISSSKERPRKKAANIAPDILILPQFPRKT